MVNVRPVLIKVKREQSIGKEVDLLKNIKKLDFNKKEWEEFLKNIDFTDVEIKIITFLRRGWRQVDIAQELFLCEKTINRYCKKIKNKIVFYIALH